MNKQETKLFVFVKRQVATCQNHQILSLEQDSGGKL